MFSYLSTLDYLYQKHHLRVDSSPKQIQLACIGTSIPVGTVYLHGGEDPLTFAYTADAVSKIHQTFINSVLFYMRLARPVGVYVLLGV